MFKRFIIMMESIFRKLPSSKKQFIKFETKGDAVTSNKCKSKAGISKHETMLTKLQVTVYPSSRISRSEGLTFWAVEFPIQYIIYCELCNHTVEFQSREILSCIVSGLDTIRMEAWLCTFYYLWFFLCSRIVFSCPPYPLINDTLLSHSWPWQIIGIQLFDGRV